MHSTAEGVIETDLYVKPTHIHQYLLSSFCHPFYCKKSIPYSQALRINRISANNDLEKYLLDMGNGEKMLRKEIPRARAIPRDALLQKVDNQENQNKINLNITNHSVFRDVRKILEELHVILASGDGHKKVPDVPTIGFKVNKNT